MNAPQPTKSTTTFPQILGTLACLTALKFGVPELTKAMMRHADLPQPVDSTPGLRTFDPAEFERNHRTLQAAIEAAEKWRSPPPTSWYLAPEPQGSGR
jgi:hypothetical protein